MSIHLQGIEQIRRLARSAERRIRLGRALHVGVMALCVALLVAVVDVALRKLHVIPEQPARLLLGLLAFGTLLAGSLAWAWDLPERAGARALDRFHGLHDRLASALAFAERPEADRTGFMLAAIEDAIAATPQARPRAAVRIRLPRASGPAALLACAFVAVLLLRMPVPAIPMAQARTIDPIEMAADDLDDVKDFLRQLQQRDPSDETKAAIEEFNKLIDDIANKRLDRTEAFRRMEALEQKLLTGTQADHRALEAQLEKIGDEMKTAELTKPAGEALADHDLDRARDALHDLAKRMRADRPKIDKQKLEQMREALKKAAADIEKRVQELEQRREELADEILKHKQKMGDGGADDEQSLLRKKERELERLDRDLDDENNASRQLDRLDRELQQAAEDLMKDLGLTAQDLDQGAEDLNRMQQQQMTDQEKEELRKKIEEVRELLRQQGQNGKSQIIRLKRFGRMARGQGQGEDPQGEGQNGQSGQGQNGQGGGQGGQGGQGGELWVVGPNGEKLLMLSRGAGAGTIPGEGGSGAQGQGRAAQGWGEGHDPNVQGGKTNPKMGTQDTQVQGADTGQGGSRSQVILGAAERGFASRSYKRVYTEYHQVAEESLAKDDIPGGYRFYVKRYFELIRPREERP